MSSVWMKLKQKQNSHVGTIVSLLWGLYNFSLTCENSCCSQCRAIWATITHRMNLIVQEKQTGTFADVNSTMVKVVAEL